MANVSTPSRADYEDYLVRLCFGDTSDPLSPCIDNAYLDFCRTLRGLGKTDPDARIRPMAKDVIRRFVSDLTDESNPMGQQAFDEAHRAVCHMLPKLYRENGYRRFHVGQSQKWINMTLKYVFTLGEERLPGYERVYPFCHVPLDNVMLERLADYDFPPLPCAWSRLDSYDEYMDRQRWIRERFPLAPMAVEFRLWLHGTVDPSGSG